MGKTGLKGRAKARPRKKSARRSKAVASRARPKTKGRKRAARRRAPISSKNRRKPSARALPIQPVVRSAESYEEALLSMIVLGRRSERNSPAAIAFNCLLSSLTPSVRDMHFRYGMKAGRLLYKIYSNLSRKYRLNPSLGVPDFLERVGYSDVSYDYVGDLLRIEMGCTSFNAGGSMHTFEAGLISGFLSSSEGRRVRVSETSCSFEGEGRCRFENLPGHARQIGLESSIRGVRSLIGTGKLINSYYCNLLWETLLHDDYRRHTNDLVRHCGGLFAAASGDDLDASLLELRRVAPALGFGSMSIKMKPMRISLLFDREARRPFVDVAISFVRGFVEGMGLRGNLEAVEEMKGDKHTITMTMA